MIPFIGQQGYLYLDGFKDEQPLLAFVVFVPSIDTVKVTAFNHDGSVISPLPGELKFYTDAQKPLPLSGSFIRFSDKPIGLF